MQVYNKSAFPWISIIQTVFSVMETAAAAVDSLTP
jgi:hypothetical protein